MRVPVRLLRSEWPPNTGLMPGNERFDALLESVRAEGIREPLTMNLDWLVIDGQHRLNVARTLGIEAVEVRVWTGTEYVDLAPVPESSWDAHHARVRASKSALAARLSGDPSEEPGPGDYPEEGSVPTSVQNAWNDHSGNPSESGS
jgi:hypothetical protein